jgi:hypothetical protein
MNDTIKYLFIDKNSDYYPQSVSLRYETFYREFNLPIHSVQDDLEDSSIHLVALDKEEVVGYIRLTIIQNKGQLTQFSVSDSMRGKLNIAKNLFKEIENKAREHNVKELWGEIRLPVEMSARIYGFSIIGDTFPSKKTGIPHKKIVKSL